METGGIEASPYINQNKTGPSTSLDNWDYFGHNASCLLFSVGATRP